MLLRSVFTPYDSIDLVDRLRRCPPNLLIGWSRGLLPHPPPVYAVFQLLLHILCLVSPLVLLTLGKRSPYNWSSYVQHTPTHQEGTTVSTRTPHIMNVMYLNEDSGHVLVANRKFDDSVPALEVREVVSDLQKVIDKSIRIITHSSYKKGESPFSNRLNEENFISTLEKSLNGFKVVSGESFSKESSIRSVLALLESEAAYMPAVLNIIIAPRGSGLVAKVADKKVVTDKVSYGSACEIENAFRSVLNEIPSRDWLFDQAAVVGVRENETYVVDIEEGTTDEVIEVLEKFYDLDYKDNLLTYFGGDWDYQIMPFDSLETDDAAEVLDTISRPESTFIVDLSGSKGYPVVGVPQMVGSDDPVWFDIMDRASIVSAIAKVKEMGD